MKILQSLSSLSVQTMKQENAHEDSRFSRDITPENLQMTEHDRAGLHGDRDSVCAPLVRRSCMFCDGTPLICESALRLANKVFAICVHIGAIFDGRT